MSVSLNPSLLALLIISTVIWISGNGLIPLLPVYASSLGADSAGIGIYLAFSYGFLALGAFCSTRLMATHRRALWVLLLTGALSTPGALLVGYVTNLEQLVAATAFIWFLGGAGFSALNVLYAALSAQAQQANNTPSHQEKRMGLLAATSPLGSVIGGMFSGQIVDTWSFEALFLSLALLNILWPLCAGFMLIVTRKSDALAEEKALSTAGEDTAFLNADDLISVRSHHRKLLAATSLSYLSYYMALLAISLLMQDAGYSASAIASTAVVGGLVSLPLIYGIVFISSYLGRRKAWLLCNAAGVLSLLCLLFAHSLYHFWFVAAMIRCLSAGSRGIGLSWAMDLSQPTRHPAADLRLQAPHTMSATAFTNKAMALLSAAPWIGGILGYLSVGYLSLWASNTVAIMVAMLAPALSIAFALSINTRSPTRKEITLPNTEQSRGLS